MDLNSAAMMVGKALNDPVAGLDGALAARACSSPQIQKDMIKAMVEAGDVAGAQNMILKSLKQQIGGSALRQARP